MLTKRQFLRLGSLTAIAAGYNKVEAALAQSNPSRASLADIKNIAEAGYIYGLPIVMFYAGMYDYAVDKQSRQYSPFNVLRNAPNVYTYQDTEVVTPNSDTPYSFLIMDLRAEPVVISVPAIDKNRYYSIMLCDANTYNFGYIGSRATGNEAGDFIVVGPHWNGDTPPGIRKLFRASSQFSVAQYRTQLFNPADLDNVKEIQSRYKAQTLSIYLKQSPPAPAPTIDFPKINAELAMTHFFAYLDFMLQFVPADASEVEARAQLARIGVGPNKTFSINSLTPDEREQVALGMRAGDQKVEEALANAGVGMNGWRISALFGDRTFFNGDWLKRAAGTKGGIFGNSAEEAMYPFALVDSDGQPLDGSLHNYTLTFPSGQLPPVNAFWSVTMYDGKTRLLVQNPIDRYLINSPMLPTLKKAPDGSLTLYIQNRSPGADRESNWLPAPNGPIFLVMRLYWPKTTPPSILPIGQGTWQPPGVKRAL
jgi:hypothetical protein